MDCLCSTPRIQAAIPACPLFYPLHPHNPLCSPSQSLPTSTLYQSLPISTLYQSLPPEGCEWPCSYASGYYREQMQMLLSPSAPVRVSVQFSQRLGSRSVLRKPVSCMGIPRRQGGERTEDKTGEPCAMLFSQFSSLAQPQATSNSSAGGEGTVVQLPTQGKKHKKTPSKQGRAETSTLRAQYH